MHINNILTANVQELVKMQVGSYDLNWLSYSTRAD
jgi:hypothetical protein